MSMVKLIYSSEVSPLAGAGMEIVNREGELNKQASTIFGMGYDDLKPDDKSVGIHVVALGDEEHYLDNRNHDSFPKEACVKYHDTFVKYGHVFRHHRNKDPEKAIGTIKASAYNAPMGRIELFIHADKEKAAPELERLEKEGEIPFSMAAILPFDVCSVCGAMRKRAGDESECDHVANHLGELRDDGTKVFTRNTEPKFFDISFVGRPADRIAWNLKVASSLNLDSVKTAEYEGVTAPDDLACESDASRRKLGYIRDMASLQDSFAGWIGKQASVVTARDGYLYEFRKLAASQLDDETISRLREQPIPTALSACANHGIVMDVPTFFKYATGDDYQSVVQPYMAATKEAVPKIVRDRVKTASCADLCNDSTYDVTCSARVPDSLNRMLEHQSFDLKDRLIDATISPVNVKYALDKYGEKGVNSDVVEKLAETYVKYQLSAIDAVVTGRSGTNKLDAEALASVTNLQSITN